MADDLVVSTSSGGPTSSVPNLTNFSLEEITNLNGGVVTAALAQRIILAIRTANATAVDVTAATPLPVTMATGPLPADAATQTTLAAVLAAVDGLEAKDYATQVTSAAILAKLSADPATQATLAAVLAALASVAVTGTFWQATQPVSLASVPSHAVTGPLTDTELRASAVPVTANAGTNLNTSALSTSAKQDTLLTELQLKADLTETQPVSLATVPTHAVTQSGTWTVQPGNTANTTAWKVDGSAVTQPVKEVRAATPAQSSVANATSSTSLLASNANRLGASIFNDDTAGTGATLKVKLGATASASSFTIAVAPQGYFEVPYGYTGAIDGIASAATGNARITELTA